MFKIDPTINHTNAFIDLNGIPYILAEYIDKSNFRQIDRSQIFNELNVTEESMRAIVDINIDTIGRRASDGRHNVIGNTTRQRMLYDSIKKHAHRLEHRLDVLKNGILVVISYQIENNRTKHILRSAQETIKIPNRNFFVDINPTNIDDNAIIINFYDQIVSSINHFVHGTDRMILRITNIQMFYECTKREYMRNPYGEYPFNPTYPVPPKHYHKGPYHPNDDYYHHIYHQPKEYIHEQISSIPQICCDDRVPPSWYSYNRFYHFTNMGKDIELHFQEIYDDATGTFLLPCGVVDVNRSFIVNPGHRIIFRINIWKNDLVALNNTEEVARNLKVENIDPSLNCRWDGKYDYHIDKDHKQDHEIRKLWDAVMAIANGKYLSDPPYFWPHDCNVPPPPPPHHCHHHHNTPNPPEWLGWKLTLYANGGLIEGKLKNNLFIKSGTVGDIPDPEWDGHVFNKWNIVDLSTGKETNVELTKDTVITSNMIAIAKWDDNTNNNVIFDGNGGKVEGRSIHIIQNITPGEVLGDDMPEPPIRKKHKFTKWIYGVNDFDNQTAIDSTLLVFAMWDNRDPYEDRVIEHYPYMIPAHLEIPVNRYEIDNMMSQIFV